MFVGCKNCGHGESSHAFLSFSENDPRRVQALHGLNCVSNSLEGYRVKLIECTGFVPENSAELALV
jgi:hypothetical protein